MTRIFVFILFLCVLFESCNKDQNITSRDHLIEYLSKEGPDVWPSYSHIIIFCKCNNEKIGYLDIYGLRKGFNAKKYNELDYSKYISDAINLELVFDSTETYKSFTINDTISEVYHSIPFSSFLEKYTDSELSDGEFTIRNDLNYNSTLSLVYYLYINDYYSYFDDYTGFFYTHKGLPLIDEPENILLE